jgi:hypothetical protein
MDPVNGASLPLSEGNLQPLPLAESPSTPSPTPKPKKTGVPKATPAPNLSPKSHPTGKPVPGALPLADSSPIQLQPRTNNPGTVLTDVAVSGMSDISNAAEAATVGVGELIYHSAVTLAESLNDKAEVAPEGTVQRLVPDVANTYWKVSRSFPVPGMGGGLGKSFTQEDAQNLLAEGHYTGDAIQSLIATAKDHPGTIAGHVAAQALMTFFPYTSVVNFAAKGVEAARAAHAAAFGARMATDEVFSGETIEAAANAHETMLARATGRGSARPGSPGKIWVIDPKFDPNVSGSTKPKLFNRARDNGKFRKKPVVSSIRLVPGVGTPGPHGAVGTHGTTFKFGNPVNATRLIHQDGHFVNVSGPLSQALNGAGIVLREPIKLEDGTVIKQPLISAAFGMFDMSKGSTDPIVAAEQMKSVLLGKTMRDIQVFHPDPVLQEIWQRAFGIINGIDSPMYVVNPDVLAEGNLNIKQAEVAAALESVDRYGSEKTMSNLMRGELEAAIKKQATDMKTTTSAVGQFTHDHGRDSTQVVPEAAASRAVGASFDVMFGFMRSLGMKVDLRHDYVPSMVEEGHDQVNAALDIARLIKGGPHLRGILIEAGVPAEHLPDGSANKMPGAGQRGYIQFGGHHGPIDDETDLPSLLAKRGDDYQDPLLAKGQHAETPLGVDRASTKFIYDAKNKKVHIFGPARYHYEYADSAGIDRPYGEDARPTPHITTGYIIKGKASWATGASDGSEVKGVRAAQKVIDAHGESPGVYDEAPSNKPSKRGQRGFISTRKEPPSATNKHDLRGDPKRVIARVLKAARPDMEPTALAQLISETQAKLQAKVDESYFEKAFTMQRTQGIAKGGNYGMTLTFDHVMHQGSTWEGIEQLSKDTGVPLTPIREVDRLIGRQFMNIADNVRKVRLVEALRNARVVQDKAGTGLERIEVGTDAIYVPTHVAEFVKRVIPPHENFQWFKSFVKGVSAWNKEGTVNWNMAIHAKTLTTGTLAGLDWSDLLNSGEDFFNAVKAVKEYGPILYEMAQAGSNVDHMVSQYGSIFKQAGEYIESHAGPLGITGKPLVALGKYQDTVHKILFDEYARYLVATTYMGLKREYGKKGMSKAFAQRAAAKMSNDILGIPSDVDVNTWLPKYGYLFMFAPLFKAGSFRAMGRMAGGFIPAAASPAERQVMMQSAININLKAMFIQIVVTNLLQHALTGTYSWQNQPGHQLDIDTGMKGVTPSGKGEHVFVRLKDFNTDPEVFIIKFLAAQEEAAAAGKKPDLSPIVSEGTSLGGPIEKVVLDITEAAAQKKLDTDFATTEELEFATPGWIQGGLKPFGLFPERSTEAKLPPEALLWVAFGFSPFGVAPLKQAGGLPLGGLGTMNPKGPKL